MLNKVFKEKMKEHQEILPEYVSMSLSKLGVMEQVQLAVSGDITLQNTYGKCRLIVTDKQVFSYCDGDEDPLNTILLREVEAVETYRNIGNIELVLKVAGRKVKVLRFTNTLIGKVNEATKTLLKLAPKALENNKESNKKIGKLSEERKRCPKCGRLFQVGARAWYSFK